MSLPTQTKQRWPRAAALAVAAELCRRLKPHCERLIVAGSLRRGKADVGDVEILYVPRYEQRAAGLFDTEAVDLAAEEIGRWLADGTVTKREGKAGGTAWGERNKLAAHRSGMPVDLFKASAENWWNYLVCRTGPAESNLRIATAAQRLGYQWHPYGAGFTRVGDGTEYPMTSEEAVFEFVGLAAVPPAERK